MTAAASKNLARLAEAAFERRGDYEALLFEGRWHGSAELFSRACRLAGGLAALGIQAGERVVVSMANCPEVTIAYQALWRAGAVVTPATFLLTTPDLRHVIADSGAVAVITTPDFVGKVREAVEGLPDVRHVISTSTAEGGGASGDAGVLALSSLEADSPAPIVARADDDLAALLYTGGTTGRAKGVMLSHANLWFSGSAVQKASHVDGVNRGLVTLPLSHSYGILVTIGGMHSPESPVNVLLRWFDPRRFLEMIAEHRLQTSAVVPSMLHLLLAQPLEEFDLSSLVYLGCGAAPLAPGVAAEIERRIPGVTVRQGYGLTETAALISTNPVGREKPGSVGLPVPGTEVRVLDDDGEAVAAGEVGEICCRSPGLMRGYWRSGGRDPESTAETIRDGWLHTGDIGYIDDGGYLFIVDRKKDVIIRGGFNVYPRDVEDALLEHPAVTGAGVVGRPDERHGEEVVAFVSVSGEPGAVGTDSLVEWARDRIGGYKYPREVFIVDAMPLTAVGKLDRKALRTRVRVPAG
ncbi:MAG: AMP-binding protein [Solirubrobacterales bacterium]|nr:AMP-binding protein [Solirubrobacterales bacterium]